jgi:hypothetical protein
MRGASNWNQVGAPVAGRIEPFNTKGPDLRVFLNSGGGMWSLL